MAPGTDTAEALVTSVDFTEQLFCLPRGSPDPFLGCEVQTCRGHGTEEEEEGMPTCGPHTRHSDRFWPAWDSSGHAGRKRQGT